MAEIDAEVDEFAQSVVHQPSGQVFHTTIVPFGTLNEEQRRDLARWRFDWFSEAGRQNRDVFALWVQGSIAIQGLISLEADEGFVFVHLLESAPHNVGENKLYRGVPGNLFAFVCARSFEVGFDGFVGFEAKTELIEHYKLSLGAERIGSSNRMIITVAAALKLVETYFKEIDQWPL